MRAQGYSTERWRGAAPARSSGTIGRKFVGNDSLLPLWVADMDFEAPAEIVEALQARVNHHVYGYTLEPESWFEAAAGWLARRHGWKVPREWMMASPGVIPALVRGHPGRDLPG